MAYKIFENRFSKGWNQDIDPRFQDNQTYRNPVNVSVTSDGDYYSCKNLKGSTEVNSFISSFIGTSSTDVNILGSFRVVGTYSNYVGPIQRNFSILYYVKSFSTLFPGGEKDDIILYDIVNDTSIVLLTTNGLDPNHLNFPKDGTIDAVVFGETNLDKVYWEDHENVLRKIDVVDTILAKAKEVTAIPYAPIDPIEYLSQENGSGQLASGTYQFGYRYFNTVNKKYTTWSLFTNPIPIYPLDFSDVNSLDRIHGGIANESTKKSIVLKIDKSFENSELYDSIQLSVTKNTSGLLTPPTVFYVTPPNKEFFLSPSRIIYDGGGLETNLNISEYNTPDSCVRAAKTLVAKDNVLFRGNLKMLDRLVESFSFTGAKTIKKQLGLTSSSFLPFTENPSFPVLNFLGRVNGENTNGLYERSDYTFDGSTDSASNTTGPYSPYPQAEHVHNARIYANSCDVASGSGGTGTNNIIGQALPDHFSNKHSRFSVDNVTGGNIFAFTIKGYRKGMKESPTLDNQFLFNIDYVNNSVDSYSKYNVGPEGLSPLGQAPDMAVYGYRYMVQSGETKEEVAKNICTEMNATLDGSKCKFEYIPGTNEFKILSQYGMINNTAWGAEEDFGLVDVLYWVEKGSNIDTLNPTIPDLTTNPDSTAGGYKNPKNSVKYRGYFRDEVYRFGVTWQDEFGCWSQPLPFDFTDKKSRDVTLYGAPVSSVKTDERTDVAKITLQASTSPQSALGTTIGDYVGIQDTTSTGPLGDIIFLQVIEIYLDGSLLVNYREEDFSSSLFAAFSSGSITVSLTRGAEFSHSTSGLDWKFPKRENAAFPMMSAYSEALGTEVRPEDGFIQPIGLRISGIGGHPSWAKAMAIVRVRRLKNLIWQSPLINANVIMPSVFPSSQSYCSTPTGNADPIGAFGTKVFSKGVTRNIERDGANIITNSRSNLKVQTKDNNNALPIVYVVPPEYMMSQSGLNFEPIIMPIGAEIKVVDAVSFFRTSRINVDGTGADAGNINTHQMAFGIRADTPYNYYYRQHSLTNPSSDEIRFSMQNRVFSTAPVEFPKKNTTRVLDYGEMTNRGEQYTFPTNPAARNFVFKKMDKFGLEPASFANCSNEVIQQKGIVLLVNDRFGDFSMISKGTTSTATTPESFLNFGVGLYSSQKMNCLDSSYKLLDNIPYDGKITELSDGSCSVAPIVNLERGLIDDRYGIYTDVHQFIFTGTYVRLDGSSTYDVDVWGGDCFIEKGSFKIQDTSIESNTVLTDTLDNYGIIAYPDHQEILQVYLESRVNLGLQASPFTYPVRDTRSLGEFAIDYVYPYNFSYSIENISKAWVSRSQTESKRLNYPSRIIHSRQKVFQTDIEGFDRYDSVSIYDLPEDYKSLTKLTILSNGNVYAIQESSVCILPINKNVIEQSDGTEMLVNTSVLINKPSFLLTENGSQHIRSVINSDDSIFFLDANKRETFKVGGGNDSNISEMGLHSLFLDKYESFSGIKDKDIVSGYDFNNREYWIGFNRHTDVLYQEGVLVLGIDRKPSISVWSDKGKYWMTSISVSQNTKILDLVYSKSELYILGKKADNSYVIETMYTNPTKGLFLGSVNASEVSVVINGEETFGKTFDVLRVDSNERLDDVFLTVEKETGTLSQVAVMTANIKPRHDGYEFPVIYDPRGARLRGKYAIARLVMNNGDTRDIKISSIATKYRLSSRIFK